MCSKCNTSTKKMKKKTENSLQNNWIFNVLINIVTLKSETLQVVSTYFDQMRFNENTLIVPACLVSLCILTVKTKNKSFNRLMDRGLWYTKSFGTLLSTISCYLLPDICTPHSKTWRDKRFFMLHL